jgi:hypothetical protein
MFCSSCGQALAPGQPFCPQCGRPVAIAVPPVPNLDLQLQTYASRIRALSIVWFIYGGLTLLTGVGGLLFANSFLHHGFGPMGRGPFSQFPFGPDFLPIMLRFAWSIIIVRAALAFIAGWGLMERTQWGRIVAIAAGFLCLIKIPIGTALGIWTLVSLLGYRNTTLYDQLSFFPGAAPGPGQQRVL